MSRINTNVPSIQARHRLASNNFDLGNRLERLSTGLRINRGRDDPAGLIASETLRNEIRGIGQAIENSTRASNVISTAEGALNEISSLLLDMRALIIHSANDGANSTTELQADQLQIDSIIESIDRIANTTQFGGQKLLNGNFGYTLSGVAASSIAGVTIFGARVPESNPRSVLVDVTSSAQTAQVMFAGSSISHKVTLQITGKDGFETVALRSGAGASEIAIAINNVTDGTGVSATFTGSGAGTRIILNSQAYGSDAMVSVKSLDYDMDLDGGGILVGGGQAATDKGRDVGVQINGQTASADGLEVSIRANGLDLSLTLTKDRGTALGGTTFDITGGGATFQIGPEVNIAGQISIGLASMATSNLGNATLGFLNTVNSSGDNALLGGNGLSAERILAVAINQVAVIRGRLGGVQRNQIETNINSQRVALENVQAAESTIRDADIAAEVAAMTRAQILVQSTTSVLGLANQLPQSVLSLLGG